MSSSVHVNDARASVTSNSGNDRAVASLLVAAERGVDERATPARTDHRAGEQLGVTQRVGEAVRADRVLPVAGVADEGPAWSPRTTHQPGATEERPHAERRGGRCDACRECGRRLAQELAHHVGAAGADLGRRCRPRTHTPRRRWSGSIPAAGGGAEEPLVAPSSRGHASSRRRPLSRRARAHHGRADTLRDRRAHAVGADDESGVEVDALTLLVAADHASDAALVVAAHARDGDAVAHLGAGRERRRRPRSGRARCGAVRRARRRRAAS